MTLGRVEATPGKEKSTFLSRRIPERILSYWRYMRNFGRFSIMLAPRFWADDGMYNAQYVAGSLPI